MNGVSLARKDMKMKEEDMKMNMKIKIADFGIIPTRGHETDAGLDLYCPYDIEVAPHETVTIDTGVHVQLPSGTVGLIKSRSSMMARTITEGVIDEGYTGSIGICLHNITDLWLWFHKGDRIAQLVITDCYKPMLEVCDSLEDTERGSGGFGSTGA